MPRLRPLQLLALSAALWLTACGGGDNGDAPETDPGANGEAPAAMDEAPAGSEPAEALDFTRLGDVTAAPWRDAAARARDGARNPVDTLEFFTIDPSTTIVEIWPGGGWYADILAPWIHAHGGRYIAAWPPVGPDNARATALRERFAARFDHPAFGELTLAGFGPEGFEGLEPGSADAILTFRNVHNWMAGGFSETAFESFFEALKPGGILGVVEHRLPANRVQDPRAASGYVQEDYVVALAAEAGFELAGASEINANPADTADHPFGVWTLPPVGRTSPLGEPHDPSFDRAPFEEIGESDRMTLLFRKPVSEE
ncbi:class I SAM-dependent methyltransferase [Alkalicaulis satelles]|uniref:Class I SAM-dependent methyltransferase n=1 Tax=Alkalicaulis satelles TaxID=2609175 RepID=A0A5M6ZGK2_9PROT|nr:class I SAM-dependent methyltransferase [Alkalicaulis satelles]KAA5803430.1 class I SAM-dependent methyltransferase [Alkalicaulis satelles]